MASKWPTVESWYNAAMDVTVISVDGNDVIHFDGDEYLVVRRAHYETVMRYYEWSERWRMFKDRTLPPSRLKLFLLKLADKLP